MSYKPKALSKWLLLVVGLLFVNQSFAFKSNLTRPINGQEGTDARIEEGSNLFNSKCASCHALENKLVGPKLSGLIDKYEEDYDWMISWIKNNQKLIKSGDERANAIYEEFGKQAMNIFEDLSDDEITSILMYIDNGGDGEAAAVAADAPVAAAPPSDELINKVNWSVTLLVVLFILIIILIFGILELVSNLTGRNVINWNNVNAFMMILFLILFFALVIYEYMVHAQFLLPESASVHGKEIDKMMTRTFAATIPVFFITQFLLFYFSFRYRRKEGRKAYYYPHNNNLEVIWTALPMIVLAWLVSGGFRTWNKILRSDTKEDSQKIEVFAYQFGWNARYPGADNELGSANYNLISGTNPLGVANRENATALLAELRAEIEQLQIRHDSLLPLEEAKLRSTLGGRVGDDRKDHLRKIESYASGEIAKDIKLTIRARNTQIARIEAALKAENGMFDTKGNDDKVVSEVHIVKGQPVTLKFRARDVIHSAYLPYFRTQMNVVPGLPTEFTFTPDITTAEMREIKNDPEFDYYLVCNKICGNAHFNMKMKVVVEDDQKKVDEWLAAQNALFAEKEEAEAPAEPVEESTEETTEETETIAIN